MRPITGRLALPLAQSVSKLLRPRPIVRRGGITQRPANPLAVFPHWSSSGWIVPPWRSLLFLLLLDSAFDGSKGQRSAESGAMTSRGGPKLRAPSWGRRASGGVGHLVIVWGVEPCGPLKPCELQPKSTPPASEPVAANGTPLGVTGRGDQAAAVTRSERGKTEA